MTFIDRIKNYYTKKTKLSIASDIVFFAFLIALLIPASRTEIIVLVNKIRVAVWNPSISETDKSVRLDEKDYQLVLEDLQGNESELSGAKGKVIFLNLWATWCPPCIAEMPAIQELYNKYEGNSEIEFLIISNQDIQVVKEFIVKKGYTFPVYINPYKMPDVFESSSIPVTYVISKSGRIVINQVGAANWSGEKMKSILDKLIRE